MWLYYPRAIASLEAQEFARREAVGFFWLACVIAFYTQANFGIIRAVQKWNSWQQLEPMDG